MRLTDSQLCTLRVLLWHGPVTPDRAGLVEAWATVGDYWANASMCAHLSDSRLAWTEPHERAGAELMTALAAMRDDPDAWTDTVRRLNGGMK